MKQPPKVLLKYLGVSLEKGLPLSIDFAVLAGTMAALLGDENSAATALLLPGAAFEHHPGAGIYASGDSLYCLVAASR